MPRVAVCLSGHMRTFAEVFSSLESQILIPNNAEVFLSTWDVAGNAKHDKHQSDNFQAQYNLEEQISKLAPYLRNCALFDFNKVQGQLPALYYQGMVSMFWQIYQADLLRQNYETEHGFEYDIVIRARPDMYFDSGFKIDDASDIKNSVGLLFVTEDCVSDQFAIGGSRVMSIYSSMFAHLETYLPFRETMQPPKGEKVVFIPEQLLKHHLDMYRVPYWSIPLKCRLERGEHNYS